MGLETFYNPQFTPVTDFPPALRKTLEEYFGESQYSVFAFCGTPGVHCKQVLRIESRGEILGYCKVTDRCEIKPLLRHEHQVLAYLHERNVSGIPRCKIAEVGNDTLLLQTTKRSPDTAMEKRFGAPHARFLDRLERLTTIEAPLEETGLWHHIESAQPFLGRLTETKREILLRDIANLAKQVGCRPVKVCAVHEDFTPWNTLVDSAGELFVFDWEYASLRSFAGIDRIHFILQPAIMERELSVEELAWMCRREFDPFRLRVYLIDSYCRFWEREQANPPHCMSRTFDIWLQLLRELRLSSL